ncbi:50S ribosomal protein L21 [Gammaproteobacteria bacterium]|nr:50S ribosomal protein L21 [Gammaproteobacteria bacterium]
MYAIFKTGGKQYRAEVGKSLKVETIFSEPGSQIEFDTVLMISDDGKIQAGTPYLKETVHAEVVRHGRGKKIKVYKMRRRKKSRLTQGHRQQFTEVNITGIGAAGKGQKVSEIVINADSRTSVNAAMADIAASGRAAVVASVVEAVSDKAAAKPESKVKAASAKADQAQPKAKAAEAKSAEPKKAPAKAAAPKEEDAAPVKTKAAASSANADAHDLKQLSGVGPVLEKKLNEAGVTSIPQVAEWGADDVAEFDEKLNFKGRIEREGWVEQAQAWVKENG